MEIVNLLILKLILITYQTFLFWINIQFFEEQGHYFHF